MLGTRPLGWLDISLSVSLFLFFSFWCIQHLVDKVRALIRTKFPYLLLWSLFRTAVNNAVAHSFHSIQMTIWDICNINIYIKHYPLSPWLRMRSLCQAEMHLQLNAASSLQAPALFKLTQSIIKEWVSLQSCLPAVSSLDSFCVSFLWSPFFLFLGFFQEGFKSIWSPAGVISTWGHWLLPNRGSIWAVGPKGQGSGSRLKPVPELRQQLFVF